MLFSMLLKFCTEGTLVFLIDNSFKVRLDGQAQIYVIYDFQEFVLYKGSNSDPAGVLHVIDCLI